MGLSRIRPLVDLSLLPLLALLFRLESRPKTREL